MATYLLENTMISKDDYEKAMLYVDAYGGSIGSILIRIGALSEDSLLTVYKDFYTFPVLSVSDFPDDAASYLEAMEMSGIEPDWWIDQGLLVWFGKNGDLYCTQKNYFEDFSFEFFEKIFTEHTVNYRLCRSYDFDKAVDLVQKSIQFATSSLTDDVSFLRELAEEAPVIEFVNNLLAQAYEQNASDIHIEPGEHQMEARYRIDGVLYTKFSLPQERFAAISSRVKLISGIDISEKRLPQDGRLGIRLGGEEVDIRVSTVPGVHGESIVMRLLPKDKKSFELEDLGFEPDHFQRITSWIHESNGIILVTGPTGSGKSTTLYAALEKINTRDRKIITVEDPVEYQVDGITQIQTHADIGYTFARALRSILRQDPDIIMIGEIRDLETAQIAVQASLTGHLVLSTLHTNDAISAFTRLVDMGVEPFLVASPVKGVMAQRLVRRLCPHCRTPKEPPEKIRVYGETLLERFGVDMQPQWFSGAGCHQCQGSGYKGRIGIYEMIPVDAAIQDYVLSSASSNELARYAKDKYRTLFDDGMFKVMRGMTSVEELLRVISYDFSKS